MLMLVKSLTGRYLITRSYLLNKSLVTNSDVTVGANDNTSVKRPGVKPRAMKSKRWGAEDLDATQCKPNPLPSPGARSFVTTKLEPNRPPYHGMREHGAT